MRIPGVTQVPGTPSTGAPTFADPGHRPPLMRVPDAFRTALTQGTSDALAAATSWRAAHEHASRHDFGDFVHTSCAPPPSAPDALAADFQVSRDAMHARTDAETDAANFYAAYAGSEMWQPFVDEIAARSGRGVADRANSLMRDSVSRAGGLIDALKTQYARKRPYEQDPTITTAVFRPDGNPSYPSGHAAAGVGAAMILGAFLPDRAAELTELGLQVAWSRVYGGVHFQSDVIAGARIATQVATDALARDTAKNGAPPIPGAARALRLAA